MLDINELYENGRLFDGHYKLIEPLSTAGGSADVWLAIDINTIDETGDEAKATKVAIKIYRPKNFIDVEGEFQFRSEFKKVFGCHHENIIQPTYFNIFEEMPYLVLPYCPSGSTEMLIGQLRKESDIWKYVYEVASGLAYLHEHSPQIIHQDIKPANVLIDDNGNYAITDFGISAEMGGAHSTAEEETGGTFAYMAPERFCEGTPPMPESDIWAFGASLYELITGDAPYGNDGGSRQKKGENVPPIKENVPDHIKDLIYSCLSYDAKSRPTARSIVDTVLKKRYSRNKKTIAIVAAIALAAAAAVAFLLAKPSVNPDAQFNSIVAHADSIVDSQIAAFNNSEDFDTQNGISELDKALVLYNNIQRDAHPSYGKRQEVELKINVIKEIIDELNEYDWASDLADKARRTRLEEEYVRFSLESESHKAKINQLIMQIK